MMSYKYLAATLLAQDYAICAKVDGSMLECKNLPGIYPRFHAHMQATQAHLQIHGHMQAAAFDTKISTALANASASSSQTGQGTSQANTTAYSQVWFWCDFGMMQTLCIKMAIWYGFH